MGGAQALYVYERGVEATRSMCCEMWWLYAKYVAESSSEWRGIVERATLALKFVPASLKLWTLRSDGFEELATWPHPELDWVESKLGVSLTDMKKEWSAREPYEDRLGRDFYHPSPLSQAELEAWRTYLDFEEHAGDPAKIEALYARCLLACCDYPEFWLRYALRCSDPVAILSRAPWHASDDLRIVKALALEAASRVDDAAEVFADLNPRLAETAVACVNFERRQRNTHDAHHLLSQHAEQYPALLAQLVAYQAFVLADVGAARATLEGAITKLPDTVEFWLTYFHLEASLLKDPYHNHRIADICGSAPSIHLAAVAAQYLTDVDPDINRLLEFKARQLSL